MWREIFPKILAQLEGAGALTITVTDSEVGKQRQATANRRVPCGAQPGTALTRKPVLDQRIEQPAAIPARAPRYPRRQSRRASPRWRGRSAIRISVLFSSVSGAVWQRS